MGGFTFVYKWFLNIGLPVFSISITGFFTFVGSTYGLLFVYLFYTYITTCMYVTWW